MNIQFHVNVRIENKSQHAKMYIFESIITNPLLSHERNGVKSLISKGFSVPLSADIGSFVGTFRPSETVAWIGLLS